MPVFGFHSFEFLLPASIACGADNFSLLCAALKLVGLDSVVAAPDAEFTVFAPDDNAFLILVRQLTQVNQVGFVNEDNVLQIFTQLAGDLGSDAVSEILLYHVVAGQSLEFDDLVCDG